MTTLHEAAKEGDLAQCQKLINNGGAVDARDRWQMTPLHCAAWNGHEPFVGF